MRYFVSFLNVIGFHNCEIETTQPVTCLDHIRDFEKKISLRGYPNAVVISYNKFEDLGDLYPEEQE